MSEDLPKPNLDYYVPQRDPLAVERVLREVRQEIARRQAEPYSLKGASFACEVYWLSRNFDPPVSRVDAIAAIAELISDIACGDDLSHDIRKQP